MSVHVSSWLWRNSTAKGSELLLLLAIADWADDNGKAWPSVETLAQKTRLSKRQTQSIIRKLEADKLLITHPNQGPNGVNIYQIIMGGEKIAPVQSGAQGGAVQRTEGVKPTAPNTSIDTSIDTLSFSSGDEDTTDGAKTPTVEEMFQSFWESYPRPKPERHNKKASLAKFKIALKKVSFEEIIEALEWWKRTDKWKQDGGQYIDGAQKWLHQEMWEAAKDQPRKSVAQGGGQVVRKADKNESQKAWDDIMKPYYEGIHEN